MEDTKVKVGVWLVIRYAEKNPKKTTLATNMHRAGVKEVLDAWLRDQMGRGKDSRKVAERDIYTIRIGVDMTCDTFFTESDTGNDGLTCGIVMHIFKRIDELVPPEPENQKKQPK